MKGKRRNAKGEGSFTLNANGTVTHRKNVGYKANGRRKVLTVTAATKAACIREMRKKETEWNRKKNTSEVNLKSTVTELCYSHLWYQVENKALRPKSVDRRECTIENQIRRYDLGYMQVGAVSTLDIEAHITKLISEKKLSASSIEKTLDVLHAAYAWAICRMDLDSNPVYPVRAELKKRIKKLTEKGANTADVTVLSQMEVNAFVEEALKQNKNGKYVYSAGAYCLLLLYTGMRIGELLALRWQDWEGDVLVIEKSRSMAKNRCTETETEKRFVQIEGDTKNQKARIIELNEEAKTILRLIKSDRKYAKPDELIVVTRTGKENTATNMEHRLKVIFKNAEITGVNGGLHILRKTFATMMYENGARVEEVAAYIGDLVSTTQKYYIAIRKKEMRGGAVRQVVKLPKVSDGSVA